MCTKTIKNGGKKRLKRKNGKKEPGKLRDGQKISNARYLDTGKRKDGGGKMGVAEVAEKEATAGKKVDGVATRVTGRERVGDTLAVVRLTLLVCTVLLVCIFSLSTSPHTHPATPAHPPLPAPFPWSLAAI